MFTCSLGFIFDINLENVLLVHKNSPAWQKGLVNGVGGKIEVGESPLECMVRECQEETALVIPENSWQHFATIKDKDGMSPGVHINVYAAMYHGAITDACKNDHEEIEWFLYQSLPDNVISNLFFLVPMAREKLRGHDAKSIIIQY